MKIFTVLISILLLTYINTADTYCNGYEGKKADDCKELKKALSDDYCCYLKSKKGDDTAEMCVEITKDNYNNIKDYIKTLEKNADGAKVKKLDCYSVYLTGSLLSLILFFL